MALTMVHLLAADKWAQGHPEYLSSPEFYLGAISPDAIHVRDHDDKSHKDEIHLFNWRSPKPENVIAYWHDHSTPFDIGYGVHVLTDAQWVPRYVERLPGLLFPNGRLNINVYYNDNFQTDFALYRETPRARQLLAMVETAQAPSGHPLLTYDEFDQWRRDIAEAYHGECKYHNPVQYITPEYVRAFIADSTDLIEKVYKEAFP